MGCTSSKAAAATRAGNVEKPVRGVGQTERMISRAVRMKEKRDGKASMVMGGSTAETTTSTTMAAIDKDPPRLNACGNLMPEEVVKRTSSSITTKVLEIGTPEHPIRIEYAHWTQRGYYPEDPHKENQDEFSITTKFAGSPNDVLFAVYDGHGKKGHDCARYAKKKLPAEMAKHLRQARVIKYQAQHKKDYGSLKGFKAFDPEKWPLLTPAEYKQCCKLAFLETNEEIHKSPVEDNISGTTAITVSFHGTLLTVCNVGDSRAVLGHSVGGIGEVKTTVNHRSNEEEKEEILTMDGQTNRTPKEFPSSLLAIPLSRDQTPYRKDERERVKLKGAAIMSIDQMEGREEMHENWGDMVLGEAVDIYGDPPRVWVEGKDYPGTAFTRSIGDSLAESIGVTAHPEMLSREVTSNDHLLVIASDGIFEFLTNQQVVDLCANCETPIIACEKLVKAAYDQWLLYENRTDDITVIVCFLMVDKAPPTDGSTGTTEDLVELAKTVYGNKPIRKGPRFNGETASYSIVEPAEVPNS